MQKLNLPKHLIEQAGLKQEVVKQEVVKQEISKKEDSISKGKKEHMENQDNASTIEIKSIKEFETALKGKRFTDDDVLKLNEALAMYLARNRERDKSKRQNTITQINKFYNLVRLAAKRKPEQIKVKLRLIKAQITFTRGRRIISEEIKDFFDVSLKHILDSNTSDEFSNESKKLEAYLKEFVTFFESVYAYFYYEYHK